MLRIRTEMREPREQTEEGKGAGSSGRSREAMAIARSSAEFVEFADLTQVRPFKQTHMGVF